ncbi:MAG: reverse transcriptase domain-containing protein [Chloroflexota bacterium]
MQQSKFARSIALNTLYSQICSFENIYLAYRKARKGKRSKSSVAAFEYNQEEELLRLRDELQSETWQPGGYSSFYVHDPKKRLISAAPFRDRVVHHALCNLIEPIWERLFIAESYANRVGKGTHRAIVKASQFARCYAYVLQCDVVQFFPTLDHALLLVELERYLHDPATLRLCAKILASSPGANCGLPIGNLTSQIWANVYLNPFDHFVKRELRCTAYLRYVDDFLLFADDKAMLHAWKTAIVQRTARLKLALHEPQVYPVINGIPFLGFRIYPTHRRLKRRKGIAFQRRFARLYRRWKLGEISRQSLDDTARSWAAHVRWGDTYGLRKAVLGRFCL